MKIKFDKGIKRIISLLLQTFCFVVIPVLCVFPFSCRATSEGIEVIGGDYKAPEFESIDVISDSIVTLSFSEPVELTDIVVSPKIEGVSDSMISSVTRDLSPSLDSATGKYGKIPVNIEKNQNGKLFTLKLEEKTQIGKSYEVFGVVHDSVGNSLTFCVPFIGYNEKVARIILTEVHPRYTKASLVGGDVFRSEYLEFLVLNDGNLCGLEVVSAVDGDAKKYVFPAIEVYKGQIFLVHLRTAGEGCVNETDNFNEATGEYSCKDILDLWSDNTTSRLHDSCDVILIRNTVNNCVVDGIMYAGEKDLEWKGQSVVFAKELVNVGIYDCEEIDNACSSVGLTPKKSLHRIDAENIFYKLMNNEEIKYPVTVTKESWVVKDSSAGSL